MSVALTWSNGIETHRAPSKVAACRTLLLAVLFVVGCFIVGCSGASQEDRASKEDRTSHADMAMRSDSSPDETSIVEEVDDEEVDDNEESSGEPVREIEFAITEPDLAAELEMATDSAALAVESIESSHDTGAFASVPEQPPTDFGAAPGSPIFADEEMASSAAVPRAKIGEPAKKASKPTGPFSSLPAGASHDAKAGYATIQVFYATDRIHGPLPLSAYEVTGQKQAFISLFGVSICLFVVSALGWLLGRTRIATASTVCGCVTGALAATCIVAGRTDIEKRGVTYTGDRGTLARGVCEVTVPDKHQKGAVERPSLLRFEIREDQREHIVLTSATELSDDEFSKRLKGTVSRAPERDLLVFIHGYNVDFESAVQRTAQIAVDLPFEGVPICYSWPSQGTLIGYSVDETNAAWTGTHLEEFLLELANESGADSINVIAHSMGNRPMTTAMQQIRWQWDSELDPPFDRIVLAAPDVDADRFRRDLAPSLLEVANQVTLYASSDDQALVASKQVHGYPRAGESGAHIVVVPGIETIDVSGIDLSLLGHSYYGDNASMLRDLYEVVRARLPAPRRAQLIPCGEAPMTYWQLSQRPSATIEPKRR